jgi:glycosyltransferase involved in cell wall biosynthesis
MEITIAIPTYRRPDSLRDSLLSVRNQSRVDLIAEVIVSENSADKGSVEIVREFNDLPIRFVRREPTLNAGRHVYTLAAEASTEWLALLADDDMWGRYHLEEASRLLEKNPQALAAFNQTVAVQNASRQIFWSYGQLVQSFSANSVNPLDDAFVFKRGELLLDTLIKTPLNIWSMVAKRVEVAKQMHVFSEPSPGLDSDRYFVWRLNSEGVVIAGREVGLFMRVHPQMAGAVMKSEGQERYAAKSKEYSRRIVEESKALGLPVEELWNSFWNGLSPEDHTAVRQQGSSEFIAIASELLGSEAATLQSASITVARPSKRQRLLNSCSKFFQDCVPPVIHRRLAKLKTIVNQQIYKRSDI